MIPAPQKRTCIISGTVVFVLALLGVFYFFQNTSPDVSKENTLVLTDVTAEEIVRHMSIVGSEQAYKDFGFINRQFSVAEQHSNAHIFGKALFEEDGFAGVSVCDSQYSFGCYHEFLGQAIHVYGLDAARDLNEACIENLESSPLSCQHGIGHGVLSYLGYEYEDAEEALEVCRGLPYSDPIGGCYGGVFMEYNMRTMLSLDGVMPREAETEAAIAGACDGFAEEFLPACYFWQPQWWSFVMQKEPYATFEVMGEICRSIDNPILVEDCFEGIGNITANSAGYDPGETVRLCQEATENPEEELLCRSIAANSFHALEQFRSIAPEVCEGLTGAAEARCVKYSKNQLNIVVQSSEEN